jgi:hypothetical protein
MKKTTLILTIILLTSIGTAQQIEVTPSNYSTSMEAGSTYTHIVQVELQDAETPMVGTLYTEITPEKTGNDNGIDIRYDQKSFVLKPGEPVNREVIIDTHTGLKPDNFTLNTYAETQIQVKETTSGDSGNDDTDTVYRGEEDETTVNQTRINELERKYNETQKKLENINDTKEQWKNISKDLDNLTQQQRNTIQSLQQEIDNYESREDDYRQTQKALTMTLITEFALILIIAGGSIYLYKEEIIQWLNQKF